MASAAIDSRDWATADASFEASLQCAKDAPLQERIRSRALLALEAYTRGDFRKADAIGCDIHAQLLSPMLSAGVSNVLGLVAAGLGEYDRALGILNASLEVADEYGLVLLSGMIRDNLAFLVSSMGDHVRALSMCRQNLECEEVLDSDPTLSAYRYNTYATILRRSGNLIDACASYAKARQCRRDTTDSLIALDIDANLLFADGLLGRSDLHGFDRIADEANANGLVYTSLQAKLYGFILKHSYDSNVSAVALRETVVAQIDHGHCDLLLHEVGSRPQFAVFVLNLLDDTHYASMLLDLFAKNGLFSNIFSEMATNSSPLLHLALLSASTHSNDHILSEVLQLSTGARNSIRLTAAIEQASDLLSMRVHNAISTNTHLHSLTSREMQVLALMASGLRNQEIASQLFISNATVKTHINHIFAKLQVSSRIEAVLRYTDSSRGLASRGQASPPSRA
jgi:ATP/maltotriose-dependent transcriptional regulator MalT